MSEQMHCYRHPKRETRVSCATCGRPICTECMVSTDVGIKCPDDARLPRGARAGVMKTNQIVKTVLAGIGVAIVGIPVAYLILRLGIGRIILSALAGYGAGTLIHRVGGRNGGPLVMIVSGAAVLLAYSPFLVRSFASGNYFIVLPALVSIGFAVYNSR